MPSIDKLFICSPVFVEFAFFVIFTILASVHLARANKILVRFVRFVIMAC